MRRVLCFLSGLFFVLFGCSQQQEELYGPERYNEYYGSTESDVESRTVADEDGSVLWMSNDQITIFEQFTVGRAFYFSGRNGSHSGVFKPVDSGQEYGDGKQVDGYYAVYPHSDYNTLEDDGSLILTFPSVQRYEEDSFGKGSNLAVGASEDNHFSFKNVGGYLSFSFYGDNATVSSIKLEGNGGESIAGDMSVTISKGSDPEASFMIGKFAETYKSITLECDPPVELGSTADESVSFWFVVPAISFPSGLTFTVTDPDGNSFTKSSSTPRTITRSRRTPFNPIKVSFSVSVSDVTITPVSSSLQVGESVSLSATVNPQNATDKTVTWSSSNTSVATVSNGTVTAKAVGTATITASAGGKSATCNVTVTPVLVNSITLNQSSANVNVGGTVSLTATVAPNNAADKAVTWSSSDAAVATVSNSGVVTGVKAGTATITATAHDGSGVKATCAVTVSNIAVTSVTLDKTSLSLVNGASSSLTATVNPANATDKTVTWSSSNTSVATVSNGTVTAKAVGTATITASAGGKSATCTVTVSIPVTGVSLDKTIASVHTGNRLSLNATLIPSNATNKNVTWASSNTSVATVNANGFVTPVAAGSTTITVKTEDGSKTKSCVVTVIEQSLAAVDMGVSVYWANMNLGASSEVCVGTRYDNGEDCATLVNGSKWRTPTKAEWEELVANCTIEWIEWDEATQISGVWFVSSQGCKLTSKTTGNSISFITPYTSDCDGNYWTSTKLSSTYWYSHISWSDEEIKYMNMNHEYLMIRPVKVK